MAGGRPLRRSGSANTGSKPTPSSIKGAKSGKAPQGNSGPVLTATIPNREIRRLPENRVQQQQLHSANKVVLCFEVEYTTPEVWTWLREYNKERGAHLSLVNELLHAVFVVQFAEADLLEAKRSLLNASPLKVGEVYASVNDFCLQLSPCNNPAFKHLVTVNIVQDNQELIGIEDFVTDIIGKFVKARQGTDPRRISVVVETTLKLFPAKEQLQLGGPDITTVHFDYRGRNLRCCYCFSYRHLSALCRQPKPSLFASPEYTVDELKTGKHSKGGASTSGAPSTSLGPRTKVLSATDSVSRGPGIGTEQGTGEGSAVRSKRNRPRNRTGRTTSAADLPHSAGPSPGALPRPATGGATSEVVQEGRLPLHDILEDSVETDNISTRTPVRGLPAEGWSPHPTGRDLGKGLASGQGVSGPSTQLPIPPVFGTSGAAVPPLDGAGGTALLTRTDVGLRGHLQRISEPGLIASTSRDLTVTTLGGSPRKRLRSDSDLSTVPEVSFLHPLCAAEFLRPTPRIFRPVNLSHTFGVHSDDLPLPNHASVSPLLIQCAGNCIPDSQSPC